MTSFFDIKLILIIFLATLIYFIYKELILLKQKINYLIIKNKDIVTTPNEQLINEFLENTHEDYHVHQPQQQHQPQIFNDPFSCLFKKIIIPIQGNFIKKNTNDKIVLEEHEVEECEIKEDEIEKHEIKKNEIEEPKLKKNKEPIVILDTTEPTVIIESEIKTEIDSPLEIYSNDDSVSISPIIFDNNNNKSNINVLNLSKYKLPQLQDIALEYGITLQINSKKKTKNELINDIKNYLNKNI